MEEIAAKRKKTKPADGLKEIFAAIRVAAEQVEKAEANLGTTEAAHHSACACGFVLFAADIIRKRYPSLPAVRP